MAGRTYAENRPYLLPDTLRESTGLVTGVIQLPLRLDWTERAVFHLDALKYASLTYTSTMAMTTIRVETEVRDRLAARAAAHGRSLGAELQAMLDEMMWQGIEAGYRRLAVEQGEMAAYQAEAAEWTSADNDDLAATAADEYPEYNS